MSTSDVWLLVAFVLAAVSTFLHVLVKLPPAASGVPWLAAACQSAAVGCVAAGLLVAG